MDRTAELVADFARDLSATVVTPGRLHEVQRRLVDSLGCMIGAAGSPPSRIARTIAADATGAFAASALAVPSPTTVELAAFANTVMVRYLDFNDTYFGPQGGGGHPSDLVPTALALGEATRASGEDVALLVVLGYEVLCRLASTVRLRERGWDQGLYTGLAAAVMTARALDLPRDRFREAVALSLTPHVPTRQTRAGALSMWKGCATAEASRNGIFAGRLASLGMTGPPMPFEGEHGIWEQVSGPFELELSTNLESAVIDKVHTKFRPAEYNAQGVVDLAVELRERVRADDVARVHVDTYWLAYSEIGREPAKWDPTTRETADHSIPYLLARALVDGDISQSSFTEDKILDPDLRPLMARITVSEDPGLTARFSGELVTRISVTTTDGRTVEVETAHPRGHAENPLTDAEIDHKFDQLAVAGLRDPSAADDLRRNLWSIDRIDDVAAVLGALRELEPIDDAPSGCAR